MSSGPERARPRFTVISAVYNVGRYLDEFIASIEKQTFGMDRLEIVVVDDGSTDHSLETLQAWAQRHPGIVTVLSKANGGQSSARNLGLEHAHGEWVTFPDPDDILDPDYFDVVDSFLTANPQTAMIGTARIFFNEASGAIVDDHPLRTMFTADRLVDLEAEPDYFHGSAPAAFFRTDLIAANQLRFDERIRPNFEDGHFCSRYLLLAEQPLVGFLGSARYIYRKRADGSSTLQGGLLKTGRYLEVPRLGYLDLLERGIGPDGFAPRWVQNLIIYELSWYFSSDLQVTGATAAHGDVAVRFVELLRLISARIEPELIENFGLRTFDPAWRDIMLHGLRNETWVPGYAVLDGDEAGDMVRVSYRFVGDRPVEQLLVNGVPANVEHGKVWVHEYFEHDLLHERVAWIRATAADSVQVQLNGTRVDLLSAWPDPNSAPERVRSIRRPTKLVRWLAGTWPVRRRYRDAWCLMDRIHNADDNGERLFRYLRAERPDINAWFVLEKGTPDWFRLRREGYRRRLIAHGGVRWRFLMLNCIHVASSHVDHPVHRPAAILRMNPHPRWRFSFLQHGVIKDDLSRWLNPKQVDLFVTSTPQEQASIAGDGTRYSYTSREARMTGLPRFDRLRELGLRVAPEQRTRILLCPTWRYWLTPPTVGASQRRTVSDDFFDSEFAQQWLGLLNDPQLRELASTTGMRLGFLPHPNLQAALAEFALPDHVDALTFEGNDVQQLIAESALMVTDYSSMSFNAAYLDRGVVYFQFDAERVAAGGHVGRPGYFDYHRLGFGPVTESVEQTTAAILEAVRTRRGAPEPVYLERIANAFTERDGRCCERTTAAIEALHPRPLDGPRGTA